MTLKHLSVFTGALAILMGFSVYRYGFYVLAIVFTAYLVSAIIEFLFAKLRKRPLDLGLMVTPLVFALLMPPSVPLWIVAIGSGFGTFFGKCIFGGLGQNIFNPALVGRLFVTISFPAQMATMWLDPRTDVVSAVTPLIELNRGGPISATITELMLGQVPGTLGETFRIGIIVLGLLLLVLKIADWRIPVAMLSTFFLVTAVGHLLAPDTFRDPALSLIVGGLLFGAFFVATDPATAPIKSSAKLLYGVGIALLTIVIRNFAAFPEGVMFAVIIMNGVAPLLDNLVTRQKETTTQES